MSEAEKEGFLSRWSRRKRATEEAEAAAAAPADLPPPPDAAPDAPPEEVQAAPVARAACPIPDVPEIDPATLPSVESLTAESDFSLFLRPGVPTLLRNAALRRMWSLDPAIRDYIGPVDYQWDFNTPGGLPFGFANELVGDVQKLLAQAIGKIEELAEDAPAADAAQATAEVSAEVPTAEAEPAPGQVAGPMPAPGAESSPVPALAPLSPLHLSLHGGVAEPARLDTAAEVPPPPRRRHGGALPA
jgi:hypothetical protein